MGAEHLLERLEHLVRDLRRAGFSVPTGAHLDAAAALGHLPLADVDVLRSGLRATLLKIPDPDGTFDRIFSTTMLAVARPAAELDVRDAASGADGPPPAPDDDSAAALRQRIAEAMREGDRQRLAALAAAAADAVGGLDDTQGSDRYHLHRATRALDLSNLLGALLRELRTDRDRTEFEIALERSELKRLFDEFRRRLADEIARRRHGHDDDVVTTSGSGSTAVEDRAILEMSASELAELQRVVRPLARQLAARISRRRRSRAGGRIDIRRTIRRSLDCGGVPVALVTRRPHPHRPDVVVLCDVSGSVAPFAQFTFMLVNALHTELRAVRSFAFVDGVAEVSDVFETAVYDLHVRRLIERRGVVGLDGHSDYGRVFSTFAERYLDAVTRRTTVLVCGDARGNYRPSGHEALAELARRAKAVYWLNPEPQDEWNDTDSVIDEYRPHCRAVYETRTLRQLADVVGELV